MAIEKTWQDSLLPVLFNPTRWVKLIPHIVLYVKNIVLYGNYSTNVNSRKYWNKKLESKGITWRVSAYHHALPYFPSNEEFTILDIGSALGDGPELITETYPKAVVSGLEFSDVGVRVSKTKSDKITWHHLDILKDPIPGRYDFITIIHTLEHFNDPFSVVEKCLHAVNKSLIVNVPYDTDSNRRIFGVTEHRYFFDKNTFQQFNCRTIDIVDDGKGIVYEIVV